MLDKDKTCVLYYFDYGRALADWLAAYLADSETPQASNVLPFRKTWGGA
jgi:hypothetical protein